MYTDNEIKCVVCGGTDFYLELGQYFCNECQTLTQDLKEQVVEDNVLSQYVKVQKKARKTLQQIKSLKEQVTTWECYNFILRGLVEELIECGADEKLKPVVKVLWFKYLKYLKVVHDDESKPPMLQAYNNILDAETIYERKLKNKSKKRKRKNSEGSEELIDQNESNSRKFIKKKKEQVLAEYEEIKAIHESQKTEVSQTLSALKENKKAEIKMKKTLHYAPDAKKELVKLITKTRFNNHVNNINDTEVLKSVIRGSDLSHNYKTGPSILNQTKLYAILHVALLIIKDNITLSDMLRFINEGFLSYGSYEHFYPEDFDEARLNLTASKHNKPVRHSYIREIGFKLVDFLEIKRLIPMQNLVNLCERYCGELNLPDQLKDIVIKLMAKTLPNIKIVKSTRKTLPNYEARVLSFIIFTLKFLFGLDDGTEFKLSVYAEALNSNKLNMFNIKDWLNFITYRRTILSKHHFPTQHLYSSYEFDRSDVYIHFLKETFERIGMEPVNLPDYNLLKTSINDIKERKPVEMENNNIERTFTPMQDFLKTLKDSGFVENKKYLTEILDLDFKKASLDYLLRDKDYLDSETKINFGGDVEAFDFIPVLRKTRNDFQERKKIYCNFTKKSKCEEQELHHISIKSEEVISENIRITPLKTKKGKSKKNLGEVKKVCKKFKDLSDVYPVHYRPEMKFWMCNITEVDRIDIDDVMDYFNALPCSFQIIIRECSFISVQKLKEFLKEYSNVEFFLSHNFDIINETIRVINYGNTNMNKLSKEAINNW